MEKVGGATKPFEDHIDLIFFSKSNLAQLIGLQPHPTNHPGSAAKTSVKENF